MSTAIAPRPRLLIADDQTLFRTGLGSVLDADERVEVVGLAADGQQAVDMADRLRPDVVLMDIKMPIMDGIEATAEITTRYPDVKVLILTSFDTDNHVIRALTAGASGYVLKDSEPEAIISSVLALPSGERVLATAVANRMLDLAIGARTPRKRDDGLTRREMEILTLFPTGLANKQIAYKLKISEKTVRNQVSNMYRKLGIHDRSQAVLYAVRKGLVEA